MTTIINPILTSITLQSYIADAQRLLHDSAYRFFSLVELTDYANKARRKVCAETGCNAQIVQAWTLDQGVSTILPTDMIPGRRVVGLLDVYCWISTSLRLPLRYYPYSQFSRSAVVAYQYTGQPEMWTQRGGVVSIARIPGQAYTLDFDASVEPADLVAVDDIDTEVYSPFSECVKFYMCYLAKLKDQKREEAEGFLADYIRERNSVAASAMIRKLVGS